MDLIDDLGNDLAFAFLVERKHSNRLDSREALDLIGRVKTVLQPISVGSTEPAGNSAEAAKSHSTEH